MNNGWIGVDLDGTLAKYDGWVSPTHIGEPIKPMVDRVKQWLDEGKTVKIFTARAYPGGRITEQELIDVHDAIATWCIKHIGTILPITYMKDYGMVSLWDDRAVQVVPNTGIPIQDYINAVNNA